MNFGYLQHTSCTKNLWKNLSSLNSGCGLVSNTDLIAQKAVKTEESVKAEEIDGYRGGDDLDSLLQFIEDKPKSKPSGNPGSGNNPAPQQTGSGSGNSSKSKRSRRTDHKSKRSRTPSVTTPSQEKSPDTSQSQKTSRASSVSANAANHIVATNTVSGNGSVTGLTENNSTSAAAVNSENNGCSAAPDSVTTVKNSLIITNNATSNNKKSGTLKKPKKQAGWLVDFNDTGYGTSSGGKNRMKSKTPSGSKNLQESNAVKNNNNQKEIENAEVIKSCEEVISNNTNENSSDFEDDPNSIQDEIILTTPPFDEKSADKEPIEPEAEIIINTEVESVESSQINQINKSSSSEKNIARQEEDVCYNYESILKFISHEWDIVTMEITNGSNDIQSKVVYYRPREKI